ncbi:hypothetical protein [Kineosporia succinea]|uniref:Secreted protein n=1 Tax=Kineosporia succinea TaxID=84632 RepID=A0ABT9NY26_9ACTN|nr:hypothetical protein [Kineosporia succinea]MDP9825211.1 hypothetical protein [Kineosporia succinea]
MDAAVIGLVGALIGAGAGAGTSAWATRASLRRDVEKHERDLAEGRRARLMERRLAAHMELYNNLSHVDEDIEHREEDPNFSAMEDAAIAEDDGAEKPLPRLGVVDLIASEPARQAALRVAVAAREYKIQTLTSDDRDGLYGRLANEYWTALEAYRLAIKVEIGAAEDPLAG